MYDVYGTMCGTYEEACLVAGVDTPADAAREAMREHAEETVESLLRPVFCWPCHYAAAFPF